MTGLLLRWLWKPALAAFALLAVFWRGRASAKQQAKLEAAEGYGKTIKGMIDADTEIHGADPDAARRWLRERDANQR